MKASDQKRRKKRGNSWEKAVEQENTLLYLEKRAFVQRSPDEMRIINTTPNGEYIAIHARRSAPDFQGTLFGGRSVAFDAKRCEGGRFELPKHKCKKGWWHQVENLSRTSALGGITFLYVLADSQASVTTRRYVLPVVNNRVVGEDLRVTRSLKFEHLEEYKVGATATWFHWVLQNLHHWEWKP